MDCVIDSSSLRPWGQGWLNHFAPSESPGPSGDPALAAAHKLQVQQYEMCKVLTQGHATFEFVKSHKLRIKVAIVPQPDVLVGPNAQPLIPVVVLDSVLAQELIAQKKLDKQAQLKLGKDAKEIVYTRLYRRMKFDLFQSATDDLTVIRRLLQHKARHCTPSDWQRLNLPPGAHTLDSSPWYASYLTPISLEELKAIINAPEHTATTASPGPAPAARPRPFSPTAPAAAPLVDGFTDDELQKVLPLLLPALVLILKRADLVSEGQAGAFEGRDTLERWRDAAEKLSIVRDILPCPALPVSMTCGLQVIGALQAAAHLSISKARPALFGIVGAAQARANAALRKQQAAEGAASTAFNVMQLHCAAFEHAKGRSAAAKEAVMKDPSAHTRKAAVAAMADSKSWLVDSHEKMAAMTAARSAAEVAKERVLSRRQVVDQKHNAVGKL